MGLTRVCSQIGNPKIPSHIAGHQTESRNGDA